MFNGDAACFQGGMTLLILICSVRELHGSQRSEIVNSFFLLQLEHY